MAMNFLQSPMPTLKLSITMSRSMMHFLIFFVLAVTAFSFLVRKAEEAINELYRIQEESPQFQARRAEGIVSARDEALQGSTTATKQAP